MAAIAYADGFLALAKSSDMENKILYLNDQQLEVLPVDSVSRFMALQDGRLVFSKTNEAGLFIFDMSSQEINLLSLAIDTSAMNLWTAVNQAVYFDRRGQNAGLWRIDVNSRELEKITDHRPFSVGTSLSVNHLETQILMTRTDRAESDIMKTVLN